MNIGFGVEVDIEANKKARLIHEFSNALTHRFKNRTYGSGIENLDIGFICVRKVPGFETFSAVRQPKYVSLQVVKLLDGGKMEVRNSFSYDIKFDDRSYDAFLKSEDAESKNIIAEMLKASLSNFDKLPEGAKDFDVTKFKSEFTHYLDHEI